MGILGGKTLDELPGVVDLHQAELHDLSYSSLYLLVKIKCRNSAGCTPKTGWKTGPSASLLLHRSQGFCQTGPSLPPFPFHQCGPASHTVPGTEQALKKDIPSFVQANPLPEG